jgi:hypothetical protein
MEKHVTFPNYSELWDTDMPICRYTYRKGRKCRGDSRLTVSQKMTTRKKEDETEFQKNSEADLRLDQKSAEANEGQS